MSVRTNNPQECIPVGGVCSGGGLHQATVPHLPLEQIPPEQTPPRADTPQQQTPPGADPPPQSRPPQDQTHPPLAESQTPVKILPCPNFVAGGKNLTCPNQGQDCPDGISNVCKLEI